MYLFCLIFMDALGKKKVICFWSLRASPQIRVSAFLVSFLLQPKLLNRFEFCRAVFQTTFSHWVINVCAIYEASISHHSLYMGNLVWFQ